MYEYDDDKIKEFVELDSNHQNLDDVLEVVERFIRACGYNPKGALEFVEEFEK
jgi:predicted house-cleaning noncanonical NTP pyrophosphatase (MazG superfamily)